MSADESKGASFAALLPMKGHSERVSNKNLRNFCGKPLFYYILDTLIQCRYVTRVYVDTDSKEIADKAESFSEKVCIIHRPDELCGDMVSMNNIIEYDITRITEKYFIQTHSTNPLLKVQTLEAACKKFLEGLPAYDSLFSVNRWQTRLYDVRGKAVNHNPDQLIRTQDLEPLYEENSNFYIFSRESFQQAHARIGMNPQMLSMDKLESVDIDEEQDFLLAEQIYKMLHDE